MSESRWRLAALPPLPAEAFGFLLGDVPVDVVVPPSRDQAGVRAAVADADLVLGDWAGQLGIYADEIAAAPHLAFVQQPSVGYERYDVDALIAAGVPLANVGGFNAASVAEWCVAAALAVSRSLVWGHERVIAGEWPQLEVAEHGSVELAGRRVGIVGFGDIGQYCARLVAGFGCEVSYWTRTRRPPELESGARYLELDDLLRNSDVLVVVIALGSETRALLSAERLDLLPRGAVLVNAARGGIVDEDAVVERLSSGALLGAAFDVFATEPLPADSPLRSNDRVLLSPHVAGASNEARVRLIQSVAENVRRAIEGEAVRWVVNNVDPVVHRRRL